MRLSDNLSTLQALQAATNVALDLDARPLPKFITLPRRRRRRRRPVEGDAAAAAAAAEPDVDDEDDYDPCVLIHSRSAFLAVLLYVSLSSHRRM